MKLKLFNEEDMMNGLGQGQRSYTDEELLENIREFVRKNEKPPRAIDLKGKYSLGTYVSHFKSLNNAIKLAGYDPRIPGTCLKYTREELISAVIDFYSKYNKPPSCRDFRNNPEYPSIGAYDREFGNLRKCLDELDLGMDSIIKKGILGNETQKGRLFELKVKDQFKNDSQDLAGDNPTSYCDGICPSGKTYDAKSSKIHNYKGYLFWIFAIRNKEKDKIQWYYLGAFNEDYSELLHVWRISAVDIEEFVNNTGFLYVALNNVRSIERLKRYEITEKFLGV